MQGFIDNDFFKVIVNSIKTKEKDGDKNGVKSELEVLFIEIGDEWLDNAMDDDELVNDLGYICKKAFDLGVTHLYVILVKRDISPRKLVKPSDWTKFKDELTESSPRMISSSLRLFRAGHYDRVWKRHLLLLINVASNPEVCQITSELGSIVRLIFALSPEEQLAALLRRLVMVVWHSIFHCNWWDERMRKRHVRLYRFMNAEGNPNWEKMFDNRETWTEHAVRNLFIESIDDGLNGQINHLNPTKTFARELGIHESMFIIKD